MCANAHASGALEAGRPVKKAVAAARSKKQSKDATPAGDDKNKNGTVLTGYHGPLGVH